MIVLFPQIGVVITNQNENIQMMPSVKLEARVSLVITSIVLHKHPHNRKLHICLLFWISLIQSNCIVDSA